VNRRGTVRSAVVTVCVVAAGLTAWAEWPAPARSERIAARVGAPGASPGTVRIIVHAGRSAFPWRIASAVAVGVADAGLDALITTTSSPDAQVRSDDRAVVLVAPTYWWAPAWTVARAATTMRLAHETPVLPIVTASGQGARSLALLRARAVRSGGTVLDGLALYRLRPNDESPEANPDNGRVADSVARVAGRALGHRVAARPP
jgi:hypothetical protein